MLSVLVGAIILVYGFVILLATYGFWKYSIPKSNKEDVLEGVSILIPYRNPDFHHLQNLLKQIHQQVGSTENVEIILLDDFSDEEFIPFSDSNICIKRVFISHRENLSSKKNNKKQAIEWGVSIAQYDNICCLDSDVHLSGNWWKEINKFLVKNRPKFAAGIHRYQSSNSLLQSFLRLEQDVLTLFSIGSLYFKIPTMCNGANMLFSKQTFFEVGGYEGLYDIVGGDDMFLFHRVFAKYPNETFFIKSTEASVYSEAPRTFVKLMRQRERWLAKAPNYENMKIKFITISIGLANLSFFFVGFVEQWAICVFVSKFLVDTILILFARRFFRAKLPILDIVLFVLVYPLYACVVGTYTLFSYSKDN